jgi:hypothetical protein
MDNIWNAQFNLCLNMFILYLLNASTYSWYWSFVKALLAEFTHSLYQKQNIPQNSCPPHRQWSQEMKSEWALVLHHRHPGSRWAAFKSPVVVELGKILTKFSKSFSLNAMQCVGNGLAYCSTNGSQYSRFKLLRNWRIMKKCETFIKQ